MTGQPCLGVSWGSRWGSPLLPASWAHHGVECSQDTALQRQGTAANTTCALKLCRPQDPGAGFSPPGSGGYQPQRQLPPAWTDGAAVSTAGRFVGQWESRPVGDPLSLYSEAALSPVSPDPTGVPGSGEGTASLSRGVVKPTSVTTPFVPPLQLPARIRWGPRPIPVEKRLPGKETTMADIVWPGHTCARLR